MFWEDKTVLVTGGTGSFGKMFLKIMLQDFHPKKLIVFSRDELKQHEMRTSGFDDSTLRYFIGDVRDDSRLRRAMHEVDIVVHAAALKQVPACEYNPIEAVMTNDSYSGARHTRFACVRYGNVVGSRGSVIPLFMEQRKNGTVTVTDPRMTRFWIDLEQGVRFVTRCIEQMHGGEVFVPKIPSMNIMDLVKAVAPDCEVTLIGIRPGEKVHEVLIGEDESWHSVELENMFIIEPLYNWWDSENWYNGKKLPEGFRYSSDSNPWKLSIEELQKLTR